MLVYCNHALQVFRRDPFFDRDRDYEDKNIAQARVIMETLGSDEMDAYLSRYGRDPARLYADGFTRCGHVMLCVDAMFLDAWSIRHRVIDASMKGFQPDRVCAYA